MIGPHFGVVQPDAIEAPLDPDTYLAIGRQELAWLAELGFEEVDLRRGPKRFLWRMASDRARVLVRLDIMRAETGVALGPMPNHDDGWPLGSPWRQASLCGFRAAHGLPAMPAWEVFVARTPAWGNGLVERFRTYVRGLRDLRERELAGDWSRLADAQAAAAQAGREFDEWFAGRSARLRAR